MLAGLSLGLSTVVKFAQIQYNYYQKLLEKKVGGSIYFLNYYYSEGDIVFLSELDLLIGPVELITISS